MINKEIQNRIKINLTNDIAAKFAHRIRGYFEI